MECTRTLLLLSCRFGRFRLHTSLRLRALIRSWQGVYVCKLRSTRTRFQFKKTLPVEHSSEHFCCVGTHFQAFMNLADVFFLRCFSEALKKQFRRNFRKCSRMRPIVLRGQGLVFLVYKPRVLLAAQQSAIYTTSLGPIIRSHCFSYHCYADDTQLFLSFPPEDTTVSARISDCLADISTWMKNHHLQLNPGQNGTDGLSSQTGHPPQHQHQY